MGPVGASGAWVDGEAFMGLGGGKMPCCGGSGLSGDAEAAGDFCGLNKLDPLVLHTIQAVYI